MCGLSHVAGSTLRGTEVASALGRGWRGRGEGGGGEGGGERKEGRERDGE